MKQIILIEDRVERMKRLAPIKFKSIPFLKLITASEYDEFILRLKKGELEFLNDFDCIISHKSALSVAQRDIIKKYCKSFNTTLVFFYRNACGCLLNELGPLHCKPTQRARKIQ